MVLAADDTLRLDANAVDYVLVVVYFAVVLGIGFAARRRVSDSLDFFLSGRSLPAWVTGLAFISANLGAVEIMGMSANGAQFGMATFHYFWIGAVPAMLFLGIVMMPFYYGSEGAQRPGVHAPPLRHRAHLVNALSFAVAQLLIAGINLYLLATIVNALLGWPLWVSLIVAAAIVLCYITLGGLSAAIYNEVLQFFVIVAALLPLTLLGLHRVGGIGGLVDKIDGEPAAGEQLRVVAGHRPDRHRQPGAVGHRHRLRPGLRAVLRLLDDELRRGAAGDGDQVDVRGPEHADHRVVPEDVHPVHRDRPGHDRRGAGPRSARPRPPAAPSTTTTRSCC